MAPDCEHPQCHEAMKISLTKKADKSCLTEKLSKKHLVAVLSIIVTVLIIIGTILGVAADSKYAQTAAVEEIKREHEKFKSDSKHVQDDLKEIKISQQETRTDIKEILRHLRK